MRRTIRADYPVEARTLEGIIQRCTNPNVSSYKYHGAKGVSVCDKWRSDFAAFFVDVGPRPTPKHSIDRWPNRDGNYEPGNVRWATPYQQRINRRDFLGLTRWGGKPPRSGGGRIAPAGVITRLVRRFLLLDILSDDADRSAAARRSEVRGRPQYAVVIAVPDVGPLIAQHSARSALQAVNQRRHREFGRIFHQEVYVIVLAIHLDQLRFKVHADAMEDLSQPFYGSFVKNFAPVFRHKYQMNVHLEKTMSAVSNVLVITHRPKYAGSVERLQAYKFELMPDGQQRRGMRRFSGARRFVYNRALALQKERYAKGEKNLSYFDLCKQLTEWRKDISWLADAPVHPLQQTLKDLTCAYVNFFQGRAELPSFKKKGIGESFRYPDPKQFRLEQGNSRIFLPKLGWMRYRNSRRIEGTPCNITVSLSGGKYFVSIQTKREVPQPVHPSFIAVGIDMGITRFATVSDGTVVEPLNSFKKHQKRLKRYQRIMARKQKFSNNWRKTKARITRIHVRIGNARRDFLHKASTTISKNHAVVFVEDLQVRNMSRSAAGTIEKPGRNVRAKSGLNRSILDQGWGEFRRQLEYKLAWAGGVLIPVPAHHTSQTCPECGHVSPDNRLTQAQFACVECEYENNADLVGALNVLERGYRLSASGNTSPEVGASAEEPTEVTQAVCA